MEDTILPAPDHNGIITLSLGVLLAENDGHKNRLAITPGHMTWFRNTGFDHVSTRLIPGAIARFSPAC